MKSSIPNGEAGLDELDPDTDSDAGQEDPLEDNVSHSDADSEPFSFDEDPDDLIDFDEDENDEDENSLGNDVDEESGGGEEEEWGGFEETAKKRKVQSGKDKGRKRLRALPTFATYDDYARMIEDTPEDSI